MKFKIEKNVKVPDTVHGITKYPLRKMAPGDSFFVPTSEAPRSGLYTTVSIFSKRNPEYKFTVRSVDGGWRIWRIAKESA